MPAQAAQADIHSTITFPSIPIPSIQSYLKFSLFLFCSGVLYFYKICESLFFSTDLTTMMEGTQELDNTSDSEFNETVTFSDKALFLMNKHKLCFYILMNTFCALITLIGKLLVSGLFENLTSQEETLLQRKFRRFLQLKVTFLVFVSHNNLIEDTILWLPWLALHAVFLLLLELAGARMRNSFSAVSNKHVRRRLYLTNAITSCGSFFMMLFVLRIRELLTINYTLFLMADCALLFIQSAQQMFKLLVVLNENSPRLHSSSLAYYVDLSHDVFHDTIEFINYMHMILFSQLAVTYCCIFLMVQARHYYFRISTKIRKHLQHQKIVYHISTCYAEASEDDLKKNDTCTVCWETMRSARKLPCGHSFHEVCLRRWLEQDSSCAICRQTLALNLNHILREDGAPVEEVDPTLQYVVEAFSPQNNISRWWSRFIFASFSDEQVNSMVEQIADMFPQTPRSTIQEVLQQTGSVSMAVEMLLEGRTNEQNNQQLGAFGDNNDTGNSNDSSGSDSSSDFGSDNVDDSMSHDFETPLGSIKSNSWLGERMREMIELNRRKYLESERAKDLRHLCN
ncbi:hypothetical protein M3Y95_00764100 [Aphelenchoides besseyi]|nr:hypothetical protein M3Y95_00764100 [Aphelenchoides besseyi]